MPPTNAPQWRRAPGLETSPTAAEQAAGGEAITEDPAEPARGEQVAHGADRTTSAGGSGGLYTHDETEPGRTELRETPQRPLPQAAEAVSRRSREPTAPAPAPASAETDSTPAEPELASPQVRLDTLQIRPVPRANARTASSTLAGDSRSVARYASFHESFSRSVRSLEPISDLEAAAFAGRFAADFQSFDQDQPTRRAEVLRPLLADPQACTWGWSGEGRQRADSPQPNRIYRRSDVVVFVEVIVRITPYARACPSPDQSPPEPVEAADPPGLLGPSSAPPLADPRWVAGGSSWVRMTVPITRDHDDGRLVVDPHLVPDPSA